MSRTRSISRREMLRTGAGAVAASLGVLAGCKHPVKFVEPAGVPYEGTDEQLLDDIERAAFRFFWEEASPRSGQVKDRALAAGGDTRKMASIAATGFGLAGLAIGMERGYGDAAQITARARNTLRFLANDLPHEHGFFYHFIDIDSGKRWEKCELSSIDTSILLCGVLTARQYFRDAEIEDLAARIYNRVDWPWMLNGGRTLSMGWHPESGFLEARWEHYCELMMIYLLGMGSPTHPLAPETWEAWARPKISYAGTEYISGNDPIFTHQYSQAWFDFRGKRDTHADYFLNSVEATKAHKAFCLSLRAEFPDYSERLWGISASDYVGGYTAWGGPPRQGPIDGTIVPCATGGSLPFLFADTMRVQRTLRTVYGGKVWGRYGFLDAFNPLSGWHDPDVLGIDLGITMLMAENQRTGLVWKTFMKNQEAQEAMKKAGFRPA